MSWYVFGLVESYQTKGLALLPASIACSQAACRHCKVAMHEEECIASNSGGITSSGACGPEGVYFQTYAWLTEMALTEHVEAEPM